MINPSSPSKILHSRATGRSTLADVAALAEVTTMTVSRYLREPSRVAALTAEKIKQALEVTGYTPNKQAGGLASGKSPVIAAIIPNVGNTLFAETVQALCEVFQDAGFELLLSATNYSLAREEEQVRAMLGWMPSALIITGRRHSAATLQMMRNARDRGTPVVEMWDKSGSTGAPAAAPTTPFNTPEFIQVGFNHDEAGALMAQHLVDCGYRDLAYVDSGVPEDFRAHERGLGFVRQAKAAGCEAITLVAPRSEPMAAGRATLLRLCETRLPRALAFANDHLAVGAYLHAQSVGLAVPESVAMLGFGDLPLMTQLGAGISSVATQRYAIGHATAMQVLQALGRETADVDLGSMAVDLKPAIVRRSST